MTTDRLDLDPIDPEPLRTLVVRRYHGPGDVHGLVAARGPFLDDDDEDEDDEGDFDDESEWDEEDDLDEDDDWDDDDDEWDDEDDWDDEDEAGGLWDDDDDEAAEDEDIDFGDEEEELSRPAPARGGVTMTPAA